MRRSVTLLGDKIFRHNVQTIPTLRNSLPGLQLGNHQQLDSRHETRCYPHRSATRTVVSLADVQAGQLELRTTCTQMVRGEVIVKFAVAPPAPDLTAPRSAPIRHPRATDRSTETLSGLITG